MKKDSYYKLKRGARRAVSLIMIQLALFFSAIASGNESLLPDMQNTRISISVTNVSLQEFIRKIESQTAFKFTFDEKEIHNKRYITVSVKNGSLDKVLEQVSTSTGLEFKQVNNHIHIRLKKADGPQTMESTLEQTIQAKMNIATSETSIRAQAPVPVKGKVTDERGEGLPGVTVRLKGTSNGTVTDHEGNYTLSVPNGTLVFSFISFKTKEVPINGRTTINVSLAPDEKALEEVVVVGYGTVNRRDLTGSVSSVGSKQLKDVPLSSAAEALTGRLAGVQVTTSEGAPGADVVIRVRGGGSITQDNSPIYIVDGIQVENALQTISPQDIASVDVLKDASSTAIYGARGANGVVIITTKSGKPGKISVAYNGSVGFREIARTMDVMNPYDFVTYQYERSRGNVQDSTSFARLYGTTWDTLSVYKDVPAINWQNEMFGRKAGYQNHNVAISGGSKNTTFNLSLTSNNEEGVQLESAFDRKLVNFKIDSKSDNQKFKVGFVARYLDQRINGAGTTSSGARTTNRLRHSIQYRPFETPAAPTDEFDELYYQTSSQITNPVLLASAEYRRNYIDGLNLSGYVSYDIFKDLIFRSTAGYDTRNSRQDVFYSRLTPNARQFAGMPIATIGTQDDVTINNSNTLSFSKRGFMKYHDFDFLLGQEIYETRSRSSFTETRFFPTNITAEKALANMNLGTPPPGQVLPKPFTSVSPASRVFSLFSRVNYTFDNKYLLTVSLRADRSSKFMYDKGLLYFPSGSFAWRMSQEKFMESFTFLSDAKLRVGYGTAGNNRIGDLLYRQLYGVNGEAAFNNVVLPALTPTSLPNEDLSWEKTISQNVGLDLSFFNNRIQFTVDAYKNKTKDLLLALAIPSTLGYSSQIRNVASTSNRGIEFQISAVPVTNSNFTWTSNFNLSANRNKVESLGPIEQQTRSAGWQGSDGADDYLLRVGQPVGLMYGFVTDGYYKVEDFNYNPSTGTYTLKEGQPNTSLLFGAPRPGSLKLKNLGGDSFIRVEDDRTIIGNANPKFTGGWSNQFSYKNFDLSLFVNWVVGNDIYNANKIEWTDGSFPNLNLLGIMNDRWRNINDEGQVVTEPEALAALNKDATIWSPNRAQRFYLHSWAVEDGSFLRINNLTFGYTLPSALINKIKMSQFRLFATVNNLATITNYSGYDPEVNTRRSDPLTPGVDFAGYPRSKTYVFGVNVNF